MGRELNVKDGRSLGVARNVDDPTRLRVPPANGYGAVVRREGQHDVDRVGVLVKEKIEIDAALDDVSDPQARRKGRNRRRKRSLSRVFRRNRRNVDSGESTDQLKRLPFVFRNDRRRRLPIKARRVPLHADETPRRRRFRQ